MVSSSASPLPGRWQTDTVPYTREVMDSFSDPSVRRVICQFAAQMSKSESAILNVAGYFASQDPCPMLLVQPREHDSRKFSRSRLSVMFRDTPILKGIIKTPKSRDADNTIMEKTFPGGRIIMAGSNAPAALAGDSVRLVLLDEVDRFPPSTGTEGDPCELAEARASTWSNSVVGMTSTPTERDTSRIEKAYQDSDQRQYWVPCHSCGEMQLLHWGQVKWDKTEEGKHKPETALYYCEHCDAPWTEAQRHNSVRQGEWRAREEFTGTAGFHLNALYAPWSNLSLPNLADKWLRAQGKPLLLRTFLNTVLAETWSEEYESISDTTGLMARAEAYPDKDGTALVPADACIGVGSIDVQDDRLEFASEFFGGGEENWKFEYVVIPGDPALPDVWEQVWELICEPRYSETGEEMYLRATCVDTGGHRTQQAYDFCRPRFRYMAPNGERCFVFAIKGQPGSGNIWPKRPSRSNIGNIPLFPIRVAPAKEIIYSRLQKILEPGPGYIHFPDYFTSEYYEGLTAERVVTRWDARGFPQRVWELKSQGRRNEPLDLSTYCLAALCGLEQMGLNLDRLAEKRSFELQGSPLNEDPHPGTPAEKGSSSPAPPRDQAVPVRSTGAAARQRKQKITRSGYLGR